MSNEAVGVDFDGMKTAEKVWEEMRREQPAAGLPPWHLVDRAWQNFYASFADNVCMSFVRQMNDAGIKTESHVISHNGVKA